MTCNIARQTKLCKTAGMNNTVAKNSDNQGWWTGEHHQFVHSSAQKCVKHLGFSHSA